jgi:hypothetical protein
MTRRFFPLYAHQWRLPALSGGRVVALVAALTGLGSAAFGDPDRREAA